MGGPEEDAGVQEQETFIKGFRENHINGHVDIEVAEKNDVQSDGGFKHRFLHTVCVCCSMFALGWRNGLVGPTFPDLRLIIHEDLSKASWVFTAISFGGLLGSICGGVAYDRIAKIPLFVAVTCGLGVVAGATPYCEHFVAMMVVHVLHGAFASAIDTVATSDMVVVWRDRANSYMQAIHGLFSVGAIVSPFAAESFLAKKIFLPSTSHTLSHVHSLAETEGPDFRNLSSNYAYNPNVTHLTQQVGGASYIYGETRIFVPYFISTAISFLAASLYIFVTVAYGNVYNRSIKVRTDIERVNTKLYFLNKKMKIVFTIFLATTLTLYVMAERGFTNFLMTFLISQLNWSKTEGANASATFWITFALGRLTGIGIVRVLKLSYVILGFFLFLTVGGVMLCVSVVYNMKVLVWVSIAVIGYGMSTTFASIFSWLSENVRRLTGKIASILFIFLSIGGMLFPIFVGYLMDHVTQMWFVYTQVINYFIMVVLFVFILIFYHILKKARKQRKTLILNGRE